jgi:diaminopimelate decarboxylase
MEEYDKAQLAYEDDGLNLHGYSLQKYVKRYSTPFYLYSENILENNFLEYVDGARKAGIHSMICFALKANSNKSVLKVLAKLGAGADIVSGGELLRAIKAGIQPDQIVFSGVGKTAQEIKLALKYGIYSFNVESLQELELINKLAGKMGKKARVAFRLNPKVQAKTHKHISTGFKTHKFGILCEDIVVAAKNKKYWKNTKLKGISVHIGSH